jgi:DNA-binding NarL/FixJ family response regulator
VTSQPTEDGEALLSGWRIFLCDDSDGYRILLSTVLSQAGATIVGEAGDGLQCLQLVAAAEPTVVLLDLNMPRMTGIEALPRLRGDAPDAALIVLTSADDPGGPERLRFLGADGYITKPFEVFELPQLLRAAVEE